MAIFNPDNLNSLHYHLKAKIGKEVVEAEELALVGEIQGEFLPPEDLGPQILPPYEFNTQENADFQGQLVGSQAGIWTWNAQALSDNPTTDADEEIKYLMEQCSLALNSNSGIISAKAVPSVGDIRNRDTLPFQVTLTNSKGSDTKTIILHVATHPGS